MGAARLGDLHGDWPTPPAAPVDQRALSLFHAADRDQALPGGEAGQWQGACRTWSRLCGFGASSAAGAHDFLGIGGRLFGEARHAEDVIADRKPVDAGPDRLNLPEISQPTVKGGSPSNG